MAYLGRRVALLVSRHGGPQHVVCVSPQLLKTTQAPHMSSHSWGTIPGKDAPSAKRRGRGATRRKGSGEVSSEIGGDDVREAAFAQLLRVERSLERMKPDNDVFEVILSGNELCINLGPDAGQYNIYYDDSSQQISLASPRSGGFKYAFDAQTRRWLGEGDGHDFEGMLTRDLIQQANGYPDF